MSIKSSPSSWLPYLLIALVWLVTRAYPMSRVEPQLDWQVWESKKLLEYGFAERQGGIIDVHYMTGRVTDPGKFNYVNHPYPILWLDTLAYYVCGEWGTVFLNSFFGLITCLAVFPALSVIFPRTESLVGGLLYTLAPSSIFYSVNANTVALGAMIWPFAICHIGRQQLRTGQESWLPLGLMAFLAGQISWFICTVLPALLGTCLGLGYERGKGLVFKPRKKLAAALFVGGLATAVVFVAQIFHYTYDMGADMTYLRGQASSQDGVGLVQMFFAIGMRAVLSLGPALVVGALVWVVLRWRSTSVRWYEMGALSYLVVFALAAVVLRRFFFREIHMYQYLVFPCTILTVAALSSMGRPLWTRLTLLLAVAGLSYPMIQSSIPVASQTTRKLGAYIKEISTPTEIVATNLEKRMSPFAHWDVGSVDLLDIFADRLIRNSIAMRTGLDGLPANFKTRALDVTFLYHPTLPIDAGLLADLRKTGSPVFYRFPVPEEPATFATTLRTYYWKLSGRQQLAAGATAASPAAEAEFEIYRFQLVVTEQDGIKMVPPKK
ncbi:MAG: hypothetical protein K8R23_01685 [Chthoniobacter sp.]|nr:hypothetical protein [Chthoniobacter sp.]